MSLCYNSAKTELIALRSQNLIVGSKDYAMVKSLASHQRGPGSRKKTQTHVIRDLLTSIFPALGTYSMVFSDWLGVWVLRCHWPKVTSLFVVSRYTHSRWNPAGDYMNPFR